MCKALTLFPSAATRFELRQLRDSPGTRPARCFVDIHGNTRPYLTWARLKSIDMHMNIWWSTSSKPSSKYTTKWVTPQLVTMWGSYSETFGLEPGILKGTPPMPSLPKKYFLGMGGLGGGPLRLP